MKRLCINTIANFMHNVKANNIRKMFYGKRDAVVLMYHGVANDDVNIASDIWLQVKTSAFKKQMEYIREHYNPIHLEDIGKTSSNKPNIVVTFDDGYKNNYTNAFPILKQLEIPATIFTVTSMVDLDPNTGGIFWFDRLRTVLKIVGMSNIEIREIIRSYKSIHPHVINQKVTDFLDIKANGWKRILEREDIANTFGTLTSTMIQEMDSSGLIKFGSHTHQHEIATALNLEEFEVSVNKSLEKLKVLGITPSEYFCFPNGWYDSQYIEILKKFGLKGSVTTHRGHFNSSTDYYQIPRVGIGRYYSLPMFTSSLTIS